MLWSERNAPGEWRFSPKQDFQTARSRRLDWEDKQGELEPTGQASRHPPTALGNACLRIARPPRPAVMVPLQTAILSS
jgi:hypothetical protein